MSQALRISHGTFGRVALLDMDAPLVRHAHPHCHVLIKASGADTAFLVGNHTCHLTNDCAVLIDAWEPHSYVHDPHRPRATILALYIEPRWLTGLRPNWAASGAPGFFERNVGQLTPRLRGIANELSEAMLHAPDAHRQQEDLIGRLMIAVIERFTAWRTADLGGFERNNRIDWRVRKVISAIRSDPGRVRDIASLARAFGMSRSHFFRLFEGSMRITPHVFINVGRMETAIRHVVDSGAPLADVSAQLGFSAPPHFTRFFRDHAGTSPRQFRSIARLQAH